MAEGAEQGREKGVVRPSLLAIALVAHSGVIAKERTGTAIFNILSIPANLGEPTKADADVAYISDGLQLRGCKVIRSSGDATADVQACKTLTYRAASKPTQGTAPVWISPQPPLDYVPAAALNSSPPVGPDDFPSESLRLSEQGTVVLRVDIDAEGMIARCEVVGSSGYQRIDDAARRNMCRRLKARPASVAGQPVASINLTRVTFYTGD